MITENNQVPTGAPIRPEPVKELSIMTKKEEAELTELRGLWATGKATKKQVLRCMDLERKEHAGRTAA